MEILIGLALGAGLLYVWLSGHWFGRVLAFLVLAGILGSILAFALALPDQHGNGNPVGLLIGVAAAWPLASIPLYRARARTRATRRDAQFVYPLNWTLREIDDYERHGIRPVIESAVSRRAARFPVLRLP